VPHRVPRRGQSLPPGATYADLAGDPAALSDATKNFFVVASRTGPGEEDLYLSKLQLWQTGAYPYRVDNDLRQRGVPVGGLVPSYDGPEDVTGHFDFLLQWDCPLHGFDSDEERDEVIDACRKRIVGERTAARTAKGRAAASGDRRAISQFGQWTADTREDERWPGDTTEFGVTTRRHTSGKDTFVVVHFPTSATLATDGRRKGLWSFTAKPQQHIAGTFASDALCASVSVQVQRAVEERLLDPSTVAPLDVRLTADSRRDDHTKKIEELERKIESARARCDELQREAAGLRTAAGLKAADGDHDGFKQYDREAADKDAAATVQKRRLECLQEQLRATTADGDPEPEEAPADISPVAYLQVGLARAASRNGRATPLLGVLIDRSFSNWRFRVRTQQIHWSCDLTVELTDRRRILIPLAGTVENIRERAGSAAARRDAIARSVLHEAMGLDEAAVLYSLTREGLLKQRLMPWLVEHGITSRGAKNALVDHPFPLVRRVLYSSVCSETDRGVEVWGRTVRELLIETYTGDLRWGDAACPDDIRWIATVLATVTQTTDLRKYGVSVLDLALQLGVTEDALRELVKPQKRVHGFQRPRFLQYADKAKTRVKAIGCPHGGCRGRRHADHVVLLPEVAASGFGVICSFCRRTPSTAARWSDVQFPSQYLSHVTGFGGGGRLRTSDQTFIAARAMPLALARHSTAA
jgi:hypothetical protein